ncbi:MAG: TRAP transporter large permease subunit [Rhodospirillales bacterium]|nr:TRAP transporter large permease subunit [Rhodospirillales bacterium]
MASQGGSGVLRRLDLLVRHASEGIAAALVAVEVVLLLAGVVFRYLLDRPLIWSNELAGILFLWLVSLGTVVALNRGEHMRMTVVLGRLGPRAQRFAALCARVITAFVVFVLLVPGIGYMREQAAITTPTLHVSGSTEVAGQLIALAMLLYVALRQLFADITWRELAGVAVLAAALVVGLWQAEPVFDAIGNGALVVFFVVIAGACILGGVPIAFAFGISTIAYLNFTSTVPMSIEINQIDQGMASIELLAVPMFIILGLLLEIAGIARALIDLLSALVGRYRGGLSYVLVFAIYLIAGISGSKAADQAAVAPVLLPEMKRRGVPPGELVAQLASAAAMSETIPPSLVLIIVGAVTGVSTAALFDGGLMPAAVCALGLIALIWFRSRKDQPHGEKVPGREKLRRLVIAIPALILPFVIRYAVLAGIATATEVATIGVAYTMFVGAVIYRGFAWKRLYPVLVETAALSGAILLIIGAASAMAWALTQAGFAQTLTDMMTAIPGGKIGFMAVSILLFIVLGSVLEGLPAMVLFGPLLFPIAQQVGINVVQYALVSILAMGIGLFSPPFGVGFYQTCLISRASSDEALGRIWPYMLMLVAALVLIAAVPWFTTGFL